MARLKSNVPELGEGLILKGEKKKGEAGRIKTYRSALCTAVSLGVGLDG